MFEQLVKSSLVWFPEKGIGYYPVIGSKYDEEYFMHYERLAQTEKGKKITASRVELVNKYYNEGIVVDVGVGCGDFIEKHGYCNGYDINRYAITWLEKRDLYNCLYVGMHTAATFWDSLEHIKEPNIAVSHVKKWVFVSMPIYEDEKDVLNNKHFKKNEHYWYFTKDGLIEWFYEHGFKLVEYNTMETNLGRENIGTFVFRRYDA